MPTDVYRSRSDIKYSSCRVLGYLGWNYLATAKGSIPYTLTGKIWILGCASTAKQLLKELSIGSGYEFTLVNLSPEELADEETQQAALIRERFRRS